MKRLIFTLSIVFLTNFLFAQQEVQYTNFMFSKLSFNPGFAGISNRICVNGLARQQWMGYKGTDDKGGAPNTYYFAVQAPIKLLKGGAGLSILSDEIGFEKNIAVNLSYSYHLNIGDGVLGIGTQVGFVNKQIDFSKFKPVSDADPLLQSKAMESAVNVGLSLGAYYKTENYYAGVSSTQMQAFWGAKSKFASNVANPAYKANYFLTGGYFYQLPTATAFTINPNILVKTDFASAQYDINVLAWYNNQMYAGVTYRPIDAIAILAGYRMMNGKLAGLQAGISYDLTTSAMRKGTSGTFEIYAKYCFQIVIPPKVQKHGTVLYL